MELSPTVKNEVSSGGGGDGIDSACVDANEVSERGVRFRFRDRLPLEG